jgi:predicted ATPase
MIKKIWLHNYGPFEHVELALEPLTVIVGPNASGKSIALKAGDCQRRTGKTR